jgi:hypothetical protein
MALTPTQMNPVSANEYVDAFDRVLGTMSLGLDQYSILIIYPMNQSVATEVENIYKSVGWTNAVIDLYTSKTILNLTA